MKPNLDKNDQKGRTYYAGAGLAIGAGLGMIWGPMLSEILTQGVTIVIGAGLGLVFGAAIDAFGHSETNSSDNVEDNG